MILFLIEILYILNIKHQTSNIKHRLAMRTTLEIDDDVLLAVKELSKRKMKTAGEILSELARSALTSTHKHVQEEVTEYGFPVIPKKSGAIVTVEHINKLLEGTDL